MLLPVFLRRSIEKNKKIKRKKEGKNMWENISSFIAIIGSLIAICTTIYKKFLKMVLNVNKNITERFYCHMLKKISLEMQMLYMK